MLQLDEENSDITSGTESIYLLKRELYITVCHFRGQSPLVPFIVLPQALTELGELAGVFSCTHFCKARNLPGANSILVSAHFHLF